MDTTTTGASVNRRDLPPVNVYVRIRPFIGDELERGENHNLIEILDQRHIAVKLHSSTSQPVRTAPNSYNEYEVTRIFDARCTQHELFERSLAQPVDDVFSGTNWLFCTLGLTNSGKTHTMFGTAEEPGLIPQCLQRIFVRVGEQIDKQLLFKPDGLENLMPTTHGDLSTEIAVREYIFPDQERRNRLVNILEEQDSFEDLSVQDEHYSIWISFFELYNENILDLLVQPKQMKTRKNLRLMQNEHSTLIKNLIQIPVFDQREAEDIIRFGFANRSTSKTHLNETSSRSHAVLCLTLITTNEFDEQPTMSHMYICDLAGNEPSTGAGRQLMETCNINTSLMTFKDCIRILNENQTAKKPMLVPYRNSVLTSLFRPFFVGRGRTILCCNVNPCATFITQTNDLLKFCALAQKTIIVANERKPSALIRPQRKSKNKGPKRLAREGTLKAKKINHHEEISIQSSSPHIGSDLIDSLNKSSLTIPTDVKSISYWKYCVRRALQLLQKQATHRRAHLIEHHRERAQIFRVLIDQRRQMDTLLHNNQSISQQNEQLLKEAQERSEAAHEQINSLKQQLSTAEERESHLQEEVQRLKRDLGMELYRKQDAEKKVRVYEDKLRQEQTEYQKMQYDFTKTTHELTTLQVKYDALQQEMTEMQHNPPITGPPIIAMVDERTSATTVHEEPIPATRVKRRTDDETSHEQEMKKTKRVARSSSTASTVENIPIPVQRTRKKPSNSSQVTSLSLIQKGEPIVTKAPTTRSRAKKEKPDSPVKPVQQESHSPIYATIQRDRSLDRTSVATVAVHPTIVHTPKAPENANVTPKPSTFKRIQSFFRVTPTLTSSARINRVVQVKTTTVAFGSSTPTNRTPTVILKTPGPVVPAKSNGSVVQQIATPKSKYNLRTRIFNNPPANPNEKDEGKSRTKKPLRTRK